MWNADRLARTHADAARAMKAVREAGCAIEYVAETAPEGKAVGSFFDTLAEFYS